MSDSIEVGGLFNMQSTTLELGLEGVGAVDVGDQSIYNYHGYIAYNFGDADSPVRPYFLGGAGATQYGSLTTGFGAQREIGGNTQFSTTWPLGLKLFPNAGASACASRAAGRRPTSSRTRPAGGAIPTGAATWSATPSTPISGS